MKSLCTVKYTTTEARIEIAMLRDEWMKSIDDPICYAEGLGLDHCLFDLMGAMANYENRVIQDAYTRGVHTGIKILQGATLLCAAII